MLPEETVHGIDSFRDNLTPHAKLTPVAEINVRRTGNLDAFPVN